MKKIIMFLSVAAVLLAASCASGKQATSAISFTGEWNIIAINGNAVDTSKVEKAPFIGFDRVENRIYGDASCNRFFGGLTLDTVKSEISFGQAGATRMLCPHMEVEDALLGTLDKVARYTVTDNGDVELCDAKGKVLLLIRKK